MALLPSPVFAFLFSRARSKEKVALPGSRSRPLSCAVRSSQTISTTVEICMLTPADKMCVRLRSSIMLRCAKSRFRRPLRKSAEHLPLLHRASRADAPLTLSPSPVYVVRYYYPLVYAMASDGYELMYTERMVVRSGWEPKCVIERYDSDGIPEDIPN